MPTLKSRVNLTLEPETLTLLNGMAQKEHQSVASMAKALMLEALEYREDIALSTVASVRMHESHATVKHNDAWK
ncbi:MAG: hypothetical protein AAF963_01150 [Bacteroidota bacterium]